MNAQTPLRIGFNPDFIPFSYMKNGKPVGIVIDRIHDIMSAAQIRYKFIPTDLVGLTQGLMNCEYDVLAAMAKTGEREETMAFSKPVIVSGGAWFMPIDHDPGDNDQLPEIVVTPKTGPLVSQISALYPEIKIITCNDYDDALQLTLYGNVDATAAALNWHVGKMMIEEKKYKGLFHSPKAPFKTMPLHMVTTLEDPSNIISFLNKHIPDDWGPDPLS